MNATICLDSDLFAGAEFCGFAAPETVTPVQTTAAPRGRRSFFGSTLPWTLVGLLLGVIYMMPEGADGETTVPAQAMVAPIVRLVPQVGRGRLPHPAPRPPVAPSPAPANHKADTENASAFNGSTWSIWCGESKLDISIRGHRAVGYLGFRPVDWQYDQGAITGAFGGEPVKLRLENGQLVGMVGDVKVM